MRHDDYDPPSLFEQRMIKARKTHTCAECGAKIQQGETYEHIKGLWDGTFSTFRTCGLCVAMIKELMISNRILGQLSEELYDCARIAMTTKEMTTAIKTTATKWRKVNDHAPIKAGMVWTTGGAPSQLEEQTRVIKEGSEEFVNEARAFSGLDFWTLTDEAAAEEVIAKMIALETDDSDIESAHGTADDLLLWYLDAIGHGHVAQAFRTARENIGFYYSWSGSGVSFAAAVSDWNGASWGSETDEFAAHIASDNGAGSVSVSRSRNTWTLPATPRACAYDLYLSANSFGSAGGGSTWDTPDYPTLLENAQTRYQTGSLAGSPLAGQPFPFREVA